MNQTWSQKGDFKFSAGPWNLHPAPTRSARPSAPSGRSRRSCGSTRTWVRLRPVPRRRRRPDEFNPSDREKKAKEVKKLLDDHGLKAEICAPRHWEDAHGVDGPVTSNNASDRKWALERGKRTCDVARVLGTDRFVWWPAREGTYIREAKDADRSFDYMLEFLDTMLEYDKNIRILGEMKPNEPMDLMYLPTTGHFLRLAYKSRDPKRVGVLIESPTRSSPGLDPSDEFAYACSTRSSGAST
jgi:xylose isomerase